MCLTFKEQTLKMIFRLVVPFANRLANPRLADWLANLQIGQIGRLVGTYTRATAFSSLRSNLLASKTVLDHGVAIVRYIAIQGRLRSTTSTLLRLLFLWCMSLSIAVAS